jgi:NADH-quinone oxidoreductase subunit N
MIDFSAIIPEIILMLVAIILPAIGFATRNSKALAGVTLVGIAGAMAYLAYFLYNIGTTPSYSFANGSLVLNAFSALFGLIFLGVAFVVVLASAKYVEADRNKPEYFSLILFATLGMMFVSMATDLLSLFVGIEMASICSYILVAFRKKDPKGSEAATKYFIIGGMSTGFTLFGISLLYGVTGEISFTGINAALQTTTGFDPVLYLAIIMTIAGFGFKVALVPFHAWAPDVYEGAPTTITAMLAAGSKKMGFVALFKLFLIGLIAIKADWDVVVAIIAIVTMTVGNLMALSQTNIKRMLAYSSIAQAGYILIAIPVASEYALAGGIFQIMTHAFMKGGAFLAVATLSTVAVGETITEYKGLAKRSAFMAFAIAVFLLALAGIPPLSGFASKFILFSAPVQAAVDGSQWLIWLSVAGIINSAISLFYYVRIIKFMYVDRGASEEKTRLPGSMVAAVAICLAMTIIIGLWPGPFIDAAQSAARTFLLPALP